MELSVQFVSHYWSPVDILGRGTEVVTISVALGDSFYFCLKH